MHHNRAVLACFVSCVTACVPPGVNYDGHYDYNYQTVTSTRADVAARPANCAFDLLQLRPSRPFEELAVIEDDEHYADSAELFKSLVADQVCNAGGDAVVAEPNADGYYPRGVIIRYTTPAP